MTSMVLTNGMYMSFCFFYVLSRASYGYIQCGFIPSVVWRFSNYFSSSLVAENKLQLAIYLVHLVVRHIGGCLAYWYVCLIGLSIHPPVHLYAPCTSYVPHTPVCSPIPPSVPHMSWGLLGDICTMVHLSDISVFVSTSVCLSVHNTHTSCS